MKISSIEFFRPACDVDSEMVALRLHFFDDLSDLLPYLNAVMEGARYYPRGPFIKFVYQGHPVMIEGNIVNVAGFMDNISAREFAAQILAGLEQVDKNKSTITPDPTPYNPPALLDLFKLLPKKNACQKCGQPTCMAFAKALLDGKADPEYCAVLVEEKEEQPGLGVLVDMLRNNRR